MPIDQDARLEFALILFSLTVGYQVRRNHFPGLTEVEILNLEPASRSDYHFILVPARSSSSIYFCNSEIFLKMLVENFAYDEPTADRKPFSGQALADHAGLGEKMEIHGYNQIIVSVNRSGVAVIPDLQYPCRVFSHFHAGSRLPKRQVGMIEIAEKE